MNAKEKILFVINEIENANQLSIKGKPARINSESLYKVVDINDVFNILDKLEKEEKIIKVLRIPAPLFFYEDTDSGMPFDFFDIEITNKFNRYLKFSRYIARLKNKIIIHKPTSGNEFHDKSIKQKEETIKEPIPVKIVGDVVVRGFEEKVVLQKSKNKRIQLRKFPADTKWEDITIQFLNGQEVIIKVRDSIFQITYEGLGFQDERRKLPNKQWEFLKDLSEAGGEISWRNARASAKGKKQKQLLADTLKAYFQIDEDPFYPYKKEKAYKIKINLIPEVGSAAD
jgi:hypothetical protein